MNVIGKRIRQYLQFWLFMFFVGQAHPIDFSSLGDLGPMDNFEVEDNELDQYLHSNSHSAGGRGSGLPPPPPYIPSNPTSSLSVAAAQAWASGVQDEFHCLGTTPANGPVRVDLVDPNPEQERTLQDLPEILEPQQVQEIWATILTQGLHRPPYTTRTFPTVSPISSNNRTAKITLHTPSKWNSQASPHILRGISTHLRCLQILHGFPSHPSPMVTTWTTVQVPRPPDNTTRKVAQCTRPQALSPRTSVWPRGSDLCTQPQQLQPLK